MRRLCQAAGLSAQGLSVQIFRFVEPLDSQTLRGQAAGGDQAGSLAQLALQALPGLVIEFGSQPKRSLQQLRLSFLKEVVEGYAKLVVFGSVLSYPLVHDL